MQMLHLLRWFKKLVQIKNMLKTFMKKMMAQAKRKMKSQNQLRLRKLMKVSPLKNQRRPRKKIERKLLLRKDSQLNLIKPQQIKYLRRKL